MSHLASEQTKLRIEPVPVDERIKSMLHSNQRLLVNELQSRGVQVGLLMLELELLEARLGEHVELIQDRDSSICQRPALVTSSDKYLTKKFLARRRIAVPRGELFNADQLQEALRYAASLDSPVIVKPNYGSNGDGFSGNLTGTDHVLEAINKIVQESGRESSFLIEEQCQGDEFRVFITKNGDAAVLRRDPPVIVGDGKTTIDWLIDAENNEREKNSKLKALYPITIDRHLHHTLGVQGLGLNSVPSKGTAVRLRDNSNVSSGGVCVDCTDEVHPSLVQIAYEALRAIPGLSYAGVDILCTDPCLPQTEMTYKVLEINANPGLKIHHAPARGKSRNVASFLADLIFPETVKDIEEV